MKFLKKFLKNTENVRTIYTCGFKGFYEFKECSKGITLIALVITIIVMLILVGVTLNMISGDNGILGKAERAVDITNESAIKEEVEMAIAENMMGYYGDGVSEGKDFFKYMSEKLTGYETPSGATLGCEEDGSITYTDKKGNTVFFSNG